MRGIVKYKGYVQCRLGEVLVEDHERIMRWDHPSWGRCARGFHQTPQVVMNAADRVVFGDGNRGEIPAKVLAAAGFSEIQSVAKGSIDGDHPNPSNGTVDLRFGNGGQIVSHDHGVVQQTGFLPFESSQHQCDSTGVVSAGKVAGNHCDNDLRQSRSKVISLNDQCRAGLCSAQVRMRK